MRDKRHRPVICDKRNCKQEYPKCRNKCVTYYAWIIYKLGNKESVADRQWRDYVSVSSQRHVGMKPPIITKNKNHKK